MGVNVFSVAFGHMIRAERKKKGISQEELSFRCGLDRTYISSIERGLKNCSLYTALSIAKGLDTPLWQLIQSIEPKSTDTSNGALP